MTLLVWSSAGTQQQSMVTLTDGLILHYMVAPSLHLHEHKIQPVIGTKENKLELSRHSYTAASVVYIALHVCTLVRHSDCLKNCALVIAKHSLKIQYYLHSCCLTHYDDVVNSL